MDELQNLEPIEMIETDEDATAEWPEGHECVEGEEDHG